MPLGVLQAVLSGLLQLFSVKTVAAAQRRQQGCGVLHRAVALGEALKHGLESDCEKAVGLERSLVTQQVQFHKKLVSNPPVQGSNDMRKGLVKGALAVREGVTLSQPAFSQLNGCDLSAEDIAVRIDRLAGTP